MGLLAGSELTCENVCVIGKDVYVRERESNVYMCKREMCVCVREKDVCVKDRDRCSRV